jgi:hypothetical protein
LFHLLVNVLEQFSPMPMLDAMNPEASPDETTAPSPADRWRSPLYWLSGARWDTLKYCPASERERVAVLGSTVLIPTVMAFFGMYFYARSRFAEPPFLMCFIAALAWAFVIMNTDRILLATYRPYQPFWRKFLQVCFRFGLAAVVSVAIAFPFCLDQYRPAIAHRYQTEIQSVLNDLRQEESTKRRALTTTYDTEHEAKVIQLTPLQNAILNTEVYADQKLEEEKKKISAEGFVPTASPETRQLVSQVEAVKEAVSKLKADQNERENLHRRLVEAIAREMAGQPNEFFPEPKKAGEGPRTKDMQRRDLDTTRELSRLVASLAQQTAALENLNLSLAAARLVDRGTMLDALPSRREAFVKEGEEMERVRIERLDRLVAEIAQHTEDQKRALRLHDDRYLAPIQRYENKIKGVLDPMEETIGLYKVIFLPAPDAAATEQGEQGYKWMAGLFQFLVVFGTLFLLDLVPIMAKIFSRPGPYDVLVEQAEMVANLNLAAFKKNYPENARRWAAGNPAGAPKSPGEILRLHAYAPVVVVSDGVATAATPE